MKQRITALFLALCLLLSIAAVPASATDSDRSVAEEMASKYESLNTVLSHHHETRGTKSIYYCNLRYVADCVRRYGVSVSGGYGVVSGSRLPSSGIIYNTSKKEVGFITTDKYETMDLSMLLVFDLTTGAISGNELLFEVKYAGYDFICISTIDRSTVGSTPRITNFVSNAPYSLEESLREIMNDYFAISMFYWDGLLTSYTSVNLGDLGFTSYETPTNTRVNTHDFVPTVTPPTEYSGGYTTYNCSYCSYYYIDDYTDPTRPTDPTDPDSNCPCAAFKDVAANAWYHSAADWAVSNGYISGTSATTFSATKKANRAMLATILYRMAGEPSVEGLENAFPDVKEGQYFYKSALWANANGVITGSNGNFAPNVELSRETAATILYRYAQNISKLDVTVAEPVDLAVKFPEDGTKVSTWAKDAMVWAVSNGLINGNKIAGVDMLDAKGKANRGQLAIILMNFDALIHQ